MALIRVLLTLLCLGAFCAAFAAVGDRILRALRWRMPSDGQQALVAIATGLLTTEVFLFLVQLTQHIRLGCWIIVLLLGAFALWDAKHLWRLGSGALSQVKPPSCAARILLVLIVPVTALEFLMAMAPLTGSDAMQYHFAVQKLTVIDGFHPLFSNSPSFLIGQHHLLILLGLALGSEHLSLGFIFLGGTLTAAALAALSARWVPYFVSASFALLFLLTPLIFWQISISGAPDIFMAFLASTAILVLREEPSPTNSAGRQALLAGFLGGGIAGAKYTGCVVALALAIGVLLLFRSALRLLVFTLGSLCSGIWPYARNFGWTGNPLFPFLSAKLSPNLVTPHAVIALANETGASGTHSVLSLFPFLFFAKAQNSSVGFYDFFGPTVLALAPLILLAFRNTRAWRISLLVWLVSAAGIFFASGLPRFLLVVYPIALACVAAGYQEAFSRRYTLVSRTSAALLLVISLAGAAGLVVYGVQPIRAAVGMQSKSAYLEQRSQEYQIVEAINKMLGKMNNHAKALVFVRHCYYLDIPYVNGDPDTTLEIDPERMRSSSDWKAFFAQKGIGFVVRSSQYPASISASLNEMEKNGELVPFAETEVRNLQGKRIDEKWTTVAVVVLKVNP